MMMGSTASVRLIGAICIVFSQSAISEKPCRGDGSDPGSSGSSMLQATFHRDNGHLKANLTNNATTPRAVSKALHQLELKHQQPTDEEAEKAADEPETAPSWTFNLGIFVCFVLVILFAMILLLALLQLLFGVVQRIQQNYLQNLDAEIDVAEASTSTAAAAPKKKPALKRARTVAEVAKEIKGLALWMRMNGDHSRLSMLCNLGRANDPDAAVNDLVTRATKAYKLKLSSTAIKQACNGLSALTTAVKELQDQHDKVFNAKQKFQEAARRVLSMVKISRAFGGHVKLDKEERDHDDNHHEELAAKYGGGEYDLHGGKFRDTRVGKSTLVSYLSGDKFTEHTAIAFVFLYSQACALCYAMYLKTRFPMMYEFMGPWLLVSRGEAMALIIQTCLMVLLLTRGLVTRVRPLMTWSNVSMTIMDKHVLIHKYLGVFLLISAALHILGHIKGSIPAIIGETDSSAINAAFTYGTRIRFNFNSWSGALKSYPAVTGVICVIVLLAFWSLSNHYVRRKWFELFHYPHLFLIVAWCAALIAHGWRQWLGIGVPLASVSVAPVVIYYVFERVNDIRKGSHADIRIKDAQVKKSQVFLTVDTGSTGFAYHTGMYCMLKVPKISDFQWHPFTIASGGGHTEFSVLFATVGDWTREFKEMLVDAQNRPEPHPYPKICVRGGYGAPAEGMKDKKHIILVGGGVGATPFLSFLSNICESAQRGALDQFKGVETAVFYWLSREPDEFVWVNEYNQIVKNSPLLKDKVSIRLVLTKALDTKTSGWNEQELGLLWLGIEIALSEFESAELEHEMGVPTNFGRPKWADEFRSVAKDVRAKHPSDTNDISVFVCGPPVLVNSLEEAASEVSTSKTKIRVYAEEF